MKIKKFIIAIALIFTVGITTILTGCDSSPSHHLSATITEFNQRITNTTPLSNENSLSRSDMVENYLDAMATIIIYQTDSSLNATTYSFGSGVCVYSGGYIATNYHVIAAVASNPEMFTIKIEFLYEGEFTETTGELIWFNVNYDLAIVRSAYVNMPYVQMSDRWIDNDVNPIRIAEPVWTLGTPADLSLFGTYSEGTISSLFHHISTSGGRVYEDLIQHNADISNGSSGGGLFDATGYLIGLNTLGLSSTSNADRNSLYFATPIYILTKILPRIVALDLDNDENTNYYIPTMGIYAKDVYYCAYFDDGEGDFWGTGMFVFGIIENGSAEKAELPTNIAIVGISTLTSAGKGSTGYYEIIDRNDFINTMIAFNSGDQIKVYYTDITDELINGDNIYNKTVQLG